MGFPYGLLSFTINYSHISDNIKIIKQPVRLGIH